jgi:plasmid stabilization system protein ParE
VGDGHRDVAVRFGRDGFVIRYRVESDAVIIVRMFHGRQRR